MTSMKALAGKLLAFFCGVALSLAASAQSVTYFHNDPSGSPLAATDANGILIWKESYRPYGEKVLKQTSSETNRIGFHGKRFDDVTGLSYMGARYYDPILGRFTGIDPHDFEQSNIHSFNRYAYANNNPYKYVDPDGRVGQIILRAEWIAVQWAARELGAAALGSYLGIGLYNLAHPEEDAPQPPTPTQKDGKKASPNSSGVSNEKDKESTLRPGPNASDSIPARGPERDFTPEERDKINEIGNDKGCHSCGSKNPGTKSGNFVPDHQPPNGLNADNGPQRLYPQCLGCSRTQGGQVRGLVSGRKEGDQ